MTSTTSTSLPSTGVCPSPPARATGLELLGEMAGSGYRQPPLLVRRADGQTVQVTPMLYRVLEEVDGVRSSGDIAASVSQRLGRLLTADDVAYLVEAKLRPLGVLRGADGSEPATATTRPLLGLRGRIRLSSPRATWGVTAPFTWLFQPAVVAASCLAFAAVSWWVLTAKGLGTAVDEALHEPRLLLLLIALTVVSAAFHEVGHAAACRYGGAIPGAMGAAVYLVWPVFYTDVTDSYRLSRTGRLRVDLGGLYFNAVFALVTMGVWRFTGGDALLMIVPIQLLQMVRQLMPLVRFDGYHILADLTGIPDLFARIKPTVLSVLPSHRVRGVHPIKPWARFAITAWVVTVVPALAVGLGLVVWTLPRVVTSAWSSISLHAAALADHVAGREPVGIALGVISIVTIALAPLSMGYLVARLALKAAERMVAVTEHHPAVRGVAVAVVVALVASGGSLWSPETAGERGSPTPAATMVGDTALLGPSATVMALASAGPPADEEATVVTPGEERPAPATLAAARPAPVPAATPAAPTPPATPVPDCAPAAVERGARPLPFDPPPDPGEGDNHAVAVNGADCSSVHEAAFDLAWLQGGSIQQANRAYALAECAGCTTVAVAFQALIATGPTDLVVPENVAVAVNHACQACTTRAIAVQLVLTLERQPDPEHRAEVTALFGRLQGLQGELRRLSPAEIRTRLVETRAAIIEVLAPYLSSDPLENEVSDDEALEEVDDGEVIAGDDLGDEGEAAGDELTADEEVTGGGHATDGEVTEEGEATGDGGVADEGDEAAGDEVTAEGQLVGHEGEGSRSDGGETSITATDQGPTTSGDEGADGEAEEATGPTGDPATLSTSRASASDPGDG